MSEHPDADLPDAPDPDEEFVSFNDRVALTPGDMIRIVREFNELTQEQLASAAGISQSAVSALERGTEQLGLERAKALARALHVHPAALAFPGWGKGDGNRGEAA